MSCPFYGTAVHPGLNVILTTDGNRCGLVTSAHAPCGMEMANLAPDWEKCPRNPIINGTYLPVLSPEELRKEDAGIKAIIYLQSAIGLEETPQEARNGWRAMTPAQQQKTLKVYNLVRHMPTEEDAFLKDKWNM